MICAGAATWASGYNTTCITSRTGRYGSICAFSRSRSDMSFAANTRIETRVLIMSVVDLSSAPPAPVSAAPPSTFRIVLLLLLASVGLCALAYLAITVQGAWFGGAPTLHWTPREFTVARGSGQLRPDGLALTATDPTNAVLVSLNTSLRSADYPVIAWTTIGVADAAEVGLL